MKDKTLAKSGSTLAVREHVLVDIASCNALIHQSPS